MKPVHQTCKVDHYQNKVGLTTLGPWRNMLWLEKKFQTFFSIISMENVVYYHQEHVCNGFFDGVLCLWYLAPPKRRGTPSAFALKLISVR